MSHGISLNQISHVRLVKHSDSSYHGVIGNSGSTDSVVTGSRYLPSTPSSMAIKPIIGVPGVGIRVIAAEVITSSCVIIVVEIKFRFSTILTCIFKVPLMLEERICRIRFWWQIYQIFHFQRVVPTLFILVFCAILHSIEESFIMYSMGIEIFFNRFWSDLKAPVQCLSEGDPR